MWSLRWNDIDRGKPKDSEKNLSQCNFVHHKSQWIDQGANQGRRGERPATNLLSSNSKGMPKNLQRSYSMQTSWLFWTRYPSYTKLKNVWQNLAIYFEFMEELIQYKQWRYLIHFLPVIFNGLFSVLRLKYSKPFFFFIHPIWLISELSFLLSYQFLCTFPNKTEDGITISHVIDPQESPFDNYVYIVGEGGRRGSIQLILSASDL
jgi:hypothetical protein